MASAVDLSAEAGGSAKGVGKGYGPSRAGRRIKLRNADHVPYKCLSLGGPSRMDTLDLKTLHKLVSDGDEYVQFHSDLYSPDPARRPIHVPFCCCPTV